MKMLDKIIYCFPANNQEERSFFTELSELLLILPNAKQVDQNVHISATFPSESFPITVFEQCDILYPSIFIDNDNQNEIEIKAGNFVLANFRSRFTTKNEKALACDQITKPLSIVDFLTRFREHIVRIDHTGINIPERLITKENWEIELKKLGKDCNLYRYPIMDEWLFILPSNKIENKGEINDFDIGREPKFEFVYDTYAKCPTIQIDIETDLSRKEVEQLLPEPYGISFKDVEDYFRSVYLSHPWKGISIRIDVRFKNTSQQPSQWDTGEWLVRDGKRI